MPFSRLLRRWTVALCALAIGAGPAQAQGNWPRDSPPPPPQGIWGDYDYAAPASPEIASLLAFGGTLLPLSAGSLVWAVQGEQSGTSLVLLYLGAVGGPVLGYQYAGLHRAAAAGTALRSTIALAGMVIALDRDTDRGRAATVIATTAIDGTLALYDAGKLRDRMSHVHYGARLEFHPALVAGRLVPVATLRF